MKGKPAAHPDKGPALGAPPPKAGQSGISGSAKPSFWNLFSIDPRSLALFRMALGLLLLVDLAIRFPDLAAMYTDDGMFSRSEICRRYSSAWGWSIHFASGSLEFQTALFALAAVLGAALFAGFETRIAAIGSWILLISLHHRVPPILSGEDSLLRALLFWGMFLPLERKWSIDDWLARRKGSIEIDATRNPVLSVASCALLIQMALMYLFSAIFKTNASWLRGDALAGTLAHNFFASDLGAQLLQFPRLLSAMTWTTFICEWAGPFLLLCPWRTARVRMIGVCALALLHLGIAVFLEVGLFSFVALAGLAVFLPPEFWESSLVKRILPSESNLGSAAKGSVQPYSAFHYAAQGICLLFLIYVFAVNINSLPGQPLGPSGPEKWRPFATGVGLSQRWGMFEEAPSNNGWYVARAQLQDGSEVDLLQNGAPVDWRKPASPALIYKNDRWRKLFREMAYYDAFGYQVFRVPVAQYFCREWNRGKPAAKQVAEFEFIYCKEPTKTASQVTTESLVRLDLTGP